MKLGIRTKAVLFAIGCVFAVLAYHYGVILLMIAIGVQSQYLLPISVGVALLAMLIGAIIIDSLSKE